MVRMQRGESTPERSSKALGACASRMATSTFVTTFLLVSAPGLLVLDDRLLNRTTALQRSAGGHDTQVWRDPSPNETIFDCAVELHQERKRHNLDSAVTVVALANEAINSAHLMSELQSLAPTSVVLECASQVEFHRTTALLRTQPLDGAAIYLEAETGLADGVVFGKAPPQLNAAVAALYPQRERRECWGPDEGEYR